MHKKIARRSVRWDADQRRRKKSQRAANFQGKSHLQVQLNQRPRIQVQHNRHCHRTAQQPPQNHARVERAARQNVVSVRKNVPLSPYTKELTDMRVHLEEIDCLNEFYNNQVKTIALIIRKPMHWLLISLRPKSITRLYWLSLTKI
jgi:hypothetical protein